MAPDSNFTVDFSSRDMLEQGRDSYSVLRGPFDQWLALKTEEAGADCICGIPVESLVKDDAGKVVGIRAGEDEITAEVVLLCDGVNSLLAGQAVGAARPRPADVAVGVKQVIEPPAHVITDRVLAGGDDEGAAWLFAGDVTKGTFGGGFVYTNRESVSIGVVAGVESTMSNGRAPVYQMLEDLKVHPSVAPLIAGGKVVEHSGHMVSEGGFDCMPDLVGDGVMLAGDCAMMCINLGYQVRGMDFAVAAGMHAGRQAAKAIDAGDTSKAGLQGYVDALEDSFVMKDLRRFRGVPVFMEGFDRMYDAYPQMVGDMMNGMFVVDGTPARPLKQTMKPIVKRVGFMNVARDVRGALKAL